MPDPARGPATLPGRRVPTLRSPQAGGSQPCALEHALGWPRKVRIWAWAGVLMHVPRHGRPMGAACGCVAAGPRGRGAACPSSVFPYAFSLL